MMWWMFRLVTYVYRDKEGHYHCQNAIGPFLGQHFVVHKDKWEEFYEKEKEEREFEFMDGLCECGLRPGETREHDGKVWYRPDIDG